MTQGGNDPRQLLRAEWLLLLACLFLIFVLNFTSIRNKTLTYDEPWHLRNALWFAQGNAARIGAAQMPFSVLNVAPVILLERLPRDLPSLEAFALQLTGAPLVAARLMTSLCSLILATIVYFWSRRIYGSLGGGLSLILYTFSPNILAHSRLITTDLFATLMFTASLYSLWAFLNFGGWKRGLICSTALGVSQLAKYSCVFLYPLFLLLSILHWLPNIRNEGWRFFRASNLRRASSYLLLFIFVSVVIIQAGFQFHDVYRPLDSYEFKSEMFRSLQENAGAISSLPIPLPHSFLDGLDWVVFHDETGTAQGRIYLLGERRQGRGFLSYYVVAVLFKAPIATLLLFGVAIAQIWRRGNSAMVWRNEIFLFVPLLSLFIYFSVFFDTQVGLRYLLPAFPLVFIICGCATLEWKRKTGAFKMLGILLLMYFVGSSMSYYPHYISYFNELVTDRKMAYKILADSNLEWGQNFNYARDYLAAHPEAMMNPEGPVSGRVVVDANNLVGIFADHPENEFAWLRDNFEPVDHIAYGWLVFEVSEDDLKKIKRRD